MSREIKFRIWDKFFKKFLEDDYESKNTLENDDYEISECKSLTQELIEKNNIPIIEKENIIMDGQWVIGNKYQNPELMELIKK